MGECDLPLSFDYGLALLLPDRARRGVVPTWPATTVSATGARSGRRDNYPEMVERTRDAGPQLTHFRKLFAQPDMISAMASSFVIGVAGGSGSGKTTVVRRIVDSLGPEQVTLLASRSLLSRSQRPAARRARRAQLRPSEFARNGPAGAARAGAEERASRSMCRAYDFTRHARLSETETFQPRRALIVEGILVFTDAALRDLMDIKVFVDTDSDTRFIRRLQRDVAERGRTMESVIDQYQSTVKPMHLEFVEPSKRYADVIIPLGGHNTVAVDLLLTMLRSVASRPVAP